FFQAEDGIRDRNVTGVQTCALPISGSVNIFSFWYEGKEKEGYIRQLTPLECERLMGLPEGWTALGNGNEIISDYARYKAIGNAIAVPCAEYIMAGIAESL